MSVGMDEWMDLNEWKEKNEANDGSKGLARGPRAVWQGRPWMLMAVLLTAEMLMAGMLPPGCRV